MQEFNDGFCGLKYKRAKASNHSGATICSSLAGVGINPFKPAVSRSLYQLNKLARDIGVPPRRINEIVHGKRAITADTAIRLSRYFGTSAQFWLNLQAEYELDSLIYAERTGEGGRFDFIKAFRPAAALV